MSILSLVRLEVGEVGVKPGRVSMISSDSLATITAAGYLNRVGNVLAKSIALSPNDKIECLYDYNSTTRSGTYGIFFADLASGIFTLNIWENPGNVLLPVVDGNFANFNGTTGQIEDAGYSPSDADKTKVVMADAAVTVGDLALFTDTAGTIESSPNLIAHQQFVGIESVLTFGTGTWTITRVAQGDYVARHTAANETSIIGVDITPIIRTAASKGFRLDSFDYIYSIATDAMDAHSVTLDRIEYADNVAVSVNSIAITGALATATQANPYVTNVAVDTPAFDVTADSKYVIEVTADNAATTDYDFYGIMLRFSQTVA